MSRRQHAAPHSDTVRVEDHKVSCNGAGGALGHPRVYYEMGDDDEVTCGYCDRHFILIGGKADPEKP
jgi:uncharacterized Zn-finger protein